MLTYTHTHDTHKESYAIWLQSLETLSQLTVGSMQNQERSTISSLSRAPNLPLQEGEFFWPLRSCLPPGQTMSFSLGSPPSPTRHTCVFSWVVSCVTSPSYPHPFCPYFQIFAHSLWMSGLSIPPEGSSSNT